MAENLKSIVKSVNKSLDFNFNLISFDALSEEALLQVLLDVFFKFNIISSKVCSHFSGFKILLFGNHLNLF